MSGPATWRYVPGSDWAVVGPRVAALMVGESALPLAERIWPLLTDPEADADRLLDEMARDGLAALPSFALVEVAGDGVRLLVRGTAVARLRAVGTGTERSLDGVGVRSWREDVVDGVASAVLTVGGEATVGWELPLLGGIVRVSSLALVLEAAAPRATTGAVSARPAASSAAQHLQLDEQRPDSAAWGLVPPEEPAVAAPDPALTLDQESWNSERGDAPVLDAPVHVPSALGASDGAAPTAPDGPAPVDESYHDLVAGLTVLGGSVEDAAVRGVDEVGLLQGPAEAARAQVAHPVPSPSTWPQPATTPAPPPAPVSESRVQAPPMPAPARRVPPVPGHSPAPPGLISSIPFLAGASTPPPPAQPVSPALVGTETPHTLGRHAGEQDAHDDDSGEEAALTIARVPGGSAASPTPGSPEGWLRAVLCPSGHASPPEADLCRVCGADVGGAPQQWVDRPVVGRLQFDGPPGIVPVTGPLVIGRAPRADRVSGDAVPTMVIVPSGGGDVSRSHLRLAVEGWHVVVVDLGTTNGTVVTDPNGESRRLRPEEEKLLLPGSRVVLADTVGFVFEAQP